MNWKSNCAHCVMVKPPEKTGASRSDRGSHYQKVSAPPFVVLLKRLLVRETRMTSLFRMERDHHGREIDDAYNLTHVLGRKRHGHYVTASCPICQTQRENHKNASTLRHGPLGKFLLHREKRDCTFIDVLAAMGMRRGYDPIDAKMNAFSRNTTWLLQNLGKCSIASSKLWEA